MRAGRRVQIQERVDRVSSGQYRWAVAGADTCKGSLRAIAVCDVRARRGAPELGGDGPLASGGCFRAARPARLSASRKRGANMSERRTPEAQFQLANERTYLAWLRTALALVASGVAAARLLAGQTLHLCAEFGVRLVWPSTMKSLFPRLSRL